MNATRIAAGVAILALAGSVALVAGPPGPIEDPDTAIQAAESEDRGTASTEAEAAFVSGTRSLDEMARFTYTSVMSAEYPDGRQFATDYGWAARDGRIEHTVDASDDRIDGSAILTYDSDYYDSDDVQYPVMVITGTEVLTNERGTWEGPFELLDFPGTADEHFTSVLRGTGEYEGLTAVLYGKDGRNEGVIFPGDLP